MRIFEYRIDPIAVQAIPGAQVVKLYSVKTTYTTAIGSAPDNTGMVLKNRYDL